MPVLDRLFRVPRLMRAYREGRTAIQAGLFQLFVAAAKDACGGGRQDEDIKAAAANVINRLTGRNESRPDPRDTDGHLGRCLESLSDAVVVREAVALVLLLDVFLGQTAPEPQKAKWTPEEFMRATSPISRAKLLGGPNTENVIKLIEPADADPQVVTSITMTMAGQLALLAERFQ